jgi:hypothetical protein
LRQYFSGRQASEKLQSLVDSDGELRFWGFQDNDRIKRDTLEKPPQSWERMPEGSLLVFTNRVEVSHTAVIAARMYDANLASRLWDADEFHWVVALRDVQSVTGISSQQLLDAADVRGVFMALPVRIARHSEVLSLLAGTGWNAAEARAAAATAIRVATFDPESPLSAPFDRRATTRTALVAGNPDSGRSRDLRHLRQGVPSDISSCCAHQAEASVFRR